MQNRRDHPSGSGTIDFPGITVLRYAGDGQWCGEEDFWAFTTAQRATEEYVAARKQFGLEHKEKRTRLNWGSGPAWTRGARSYWERQPVR